MHTMNKKRREFIKISTMALAATTIPFQSPAASRILGSKRKFRMSINPGAIGVKADQEELLKMAIKYKFEAIVALQILYQPGAIHRFLNLLEK